MKRKPQADNRDSTAELVAFASTGASALSSLLLAGLALQISNEFDVSPGRIGFVISVCFVTRGVGALTLGWVSDRFGWQKVTVFSGLISCGTLLSSAILSVGLVSLTAFLVVGALADSTLIPASNVLVNNSIPKERQATVMGIKQAAVPAVGMFVAASIPLIAIPFGWRTVFVIGSALPLYIVVTAFNARGTRPDLSGLRRTSLRRSIRSRWSSLVLLGFFARMGSSAAMAFAIVVLVTSGSSETTASATFFAANFAGLVLRLLSGRLTAMARGNGLIPMAVLLAGGAVGAVIVSLADSIQLLHIGVFLATGLGWGWAGLLHYAIVRRSPQQVGTATGDAMAGLAAGAAAGPFFMGAAVDLNSFATGWGLAAICFGVAAVLALRLEGDPVPE